MTCLILQQRYGKKYNEYQVLGVEDDSEPTLNNGVTTPVPVVTDIEDFGANLPRISKLIFALLFFESMMLSDQTPL